MRTRDKTYQRLIQSRRWAMLRKRKIEAFPLCEDCLKEGVLTSAREVHHAVPVETAADEAGMRRLMFNPGNLVALCHECHVLRHKELASHSRETAREREAAKVDAFARKFFG